MFVLRDLLTTRSLSVWVKERQEHDGDTGPGVPAQHGPEDWFVVSRFENHQLRLLQW